MIMIVLKVAGWFAGFALLFALGVTGAEALQKRIIENMPEDRQAEYFEKVKKLEGLEWKN